MNVILKKRECWLQILIFTFFGVLYIYNLTHSGLWFDESIEYFYSKYMTGSVPVNPVDQSGNNMYERICISFQPPLYNLLMYVWLLFFDSEAGYRLAGVITTFAGSLGFNCAIRHLAGYKWGLLAQCFYLSIGAVAFYALECAEYNLLLCMECWMLYFFVVCAQYPKEPIGWYPLFGFFLFAFLSFCSQYGSVFFVVALFFSLSLIYFRAKNMISIYRLLMMGVGTLVFAIIPLFLFFIRVQLDNQGTSTVEHYPVFVGHFLGGFPYSLFKSFEAQVMWIFSTSIIWGWTTEQIMRIAVFVVFGCTILTMFVESRLPMTNTSVIATMVCYLLFFVLSACSFYAYNSWEGKLGCYNIIQHTRYVLFFVPLLVFTLFIGIINTSRYIAQKGHLKIAAGFVIVIMTVFIFNVAWGLYKGKIKSDGREATYAWLELKDYGRKVVVQEWLAGTFMFYYQHSEAFHDDVSKNIILTRQDMRVPEKIESHLQKLGVFELSSFYFIGSKSAIGMKNGEGIQLISDLFTQKGYKVETIRNDISQLLLVSK